MIKVNYNSETGQILGFYSDEIEYKSIPEPYIEITEEQHNDCINNQGHRKIDLETKKVINCTPIIPEKTKKDLVVELTAEYQVNVDKIQKAYIIAQINNDDNLKALLSTRLSEATAEYNQKRGVIENG